MDSLAEQAALEDILEATKPPVPEECRHLDYLLSTPFRYRPRPKGSRFRPAGLAPGVWYGSERPKTAAAEMVFYRFLFYAESPGTPFPDDAAEYTAFSARLATPGVARPDLGPARRTTGRAGSSSPTYRPCQDLAETAREIGAEVIRYASVRDPKGGANLAVLALPRLCRAAAGGAADLANPHQSNRRAGAARTPAAGAEV